MGSLGSQVILPGDGEVIGDAPDRRVELLADDDAVHVTWTRFGPHRDGADLHVHRRHTDLFYVLAGELTARLGPAGDELPVPAGTLVRIPPLVAHGFRNAAPRELRYLNLHAPGQGFAGYMRGLRDGRRPAFDQEDPPPEGGRPAQEAVLGGARVLEHRPGLRLVEHADVDAIRIAEAWCAPGTALPLGEGSTFAYVIEGALEGGETVDELPAGGWARLAAGGAPPRAGRDAPARVLLVQPSP